MTVRIASRMIDAAMASGRHREIIMDEDGLHAWCHVYHNPGDHDDMHCHNQDQIFYVIEGKLLVTYKHTDNLDAETTAPLLPGMAAIIRAGDWYQLTNMGDGRLVMLGVRSGRNNEATHINFKTKVDLKVGSPDGHSNPMNRDDL